MRRNQMVRVPSIKWFGFVSRINGILRLRSIHVAPNGQRKSREEEYLNSSFTETLTLAAHLLAREEEGRPEEKPTTIAAASEIQIDAGKHDFLLFFLFFHSKLSKTLLDARKLEKKQ